MLIYFICEFTCKDCWSCKAGCTYHKTFSQLSQGYNAKSYRPVSLTRSTNCFCSTQVLATRGYVGQCHMVAFINQLSVDELIAMDLLSRHFGVCPWLVCFSLLSVWCTWGVLLPPRVHTCCSFNPFLALLNSSCLNCFRKSLSGIPLYWILVTHKKMSSI